MLSWNTAATFSQLIEILSNFNVIYNKLHKVSQIVKKTIKIFQNTLLEIEKLLASTIYIHVLYTNNICIYTHINNLRVKGNIFKIINGFTEFMTAKSYLILFNRKLQNVYFVTLIGSAIIRIFLLSYLIHFYRTVEFKIFEF